MDFLQLFFAHYFAFIPTNSASMFSYYSIVVKLVYFSTLRIHSNFSIIFKK